MRVGVDVQVARNLMKAALEEPLNQRFMTVSESCVPLYAPSVVYHQLMYAVKSRINACTSRENWGRDEYRWLFSSPQDLPETTHLRELTIGLRLSSLSCNVWQQRAGSLIKPARWSPI